MHASIRQPTSLMNSASRRVQRGAMRLHPTTLDTFLRNWFWQVFNSAVAQPLRCDWKAELHPFTCPAATYQTVVSLQARCEPMIRIIWKTTLPTKNAIHRYQTAPAKTTHTFDRGRVSIRIYPLTERYKRFLHIRRIERCQACVFCIY